MILTSIWSYLICTDNWGICDNWQSGHIARFRRHDSSLGSVQCYLASKSCTEISHRVKHSEIFFFSLSISSFIHYTIKHQECQIILREWKTKLNSQFTHITPKIPLTSVQMDWFHVLRFWDSKLWNSCLHNNSEVNEIVFVLLKVNRYVSSGNYVPLTLDNQTDLNVN